MLGSVPCSLVGTFAAAAAGWAMITICGAGGTKGGRGSIFTPNIIACSTKSR